jgi:uncharacterized lipoprotein YmbA
MKTPRLPLWSLAVLILAGAGCATVPPPTLYVLKATDPASATATGPASVTVALGPVTVPDYLDRTDIVRRASDNRLAVADNERWAESLRAGLQRVLVADLAARLGPTVWVSTGAERAGQTDIEVPVDFETFEPDATGRVVLTASWEVRWSHGEHRSVHDRIRHVGSAPIAGTEDQVRTMSDQVADLAADLATAINATRARKDRP